MVLFYNYTLRISPAIQDMTTIVTEFGKLRYNSLLMGICASGYILQDEVDKLFGDIEGIKTFMDDIQVFRKDCIKKHIDQPMIRFGRLSTAGLKFNAPKCSFWLKETPYLGYVITREGIKPGPKKVQGIIDLG